MRNIFADPLSQSQYVKKRYIDQTIGRVQGATSAARTAGSNFVDNVRRVASERINATYGTPEARSRLRNIRTIRKDRKFWENIARKEAERHDADFLRSHDAGVPAVKKGEFNTNWAGLEKEAVSRQAAADAKAAAVQAGAGNATKAGLEAGWFQRSVGNPISKSMSKQGFLQPPNKAGFQNMMAAAKEFGSPAGEGGWLGAGSRIGAMGVGLGAVGAVGLQGARNIGRGRYGRGVAQIGLASGGLAALGNMGKIAASASKYFHGI